MSSETGVRSPISHSFNVFLTKTTVTMGVVTGERRRLRGMVAAMILTVAAVLKLSHRVSVIDSPTPTIGAPITPMPVAAAPRTSCLISV